MSGSTPSPAELDALARRAAQTVFDRPMAVEAGAGTGKTATLVNRVVAWCLGPGWEREATAADGPEETAGRVLDGVVAITFTEDAAAEMAERVALAFRRLEEWDGKEKPPANLPGLLRDALPDEPEAVRERARTLLVQIERLRVSTIHAFASSILARFPVEAGLHPAFTVDAEGTLVQEMAEATAAELLAAAYASGEEDALALAERGIGPAEITDAALTLVEKGVPASVLGEDPFTGEKIGERLDELEGLLTKSEQDLAVLSQVSRRSKAVIAAAKFLLDLLGTLRERTLGQLERFSSILKEIKDTYARRKNAIDKWAKGDFGKNPPKELDLDRMQQCAQRLAPLLDALSRMDPATFNRARRVLLGILERVEAEKRRRGVVVFQDLLAEARRLLADDDAVRRQLRSEIRQLLVDEMQDTDPEQAEIVRLLALGGDAGPGPCLFLVGDPKQSIYGWRSADLEVYERLVEEIESAGGERHALVINFRSVPAVLDEVRRVVEPGMREEHGVQPRFEPLEPCERLRDAAGFLGEAPRRRPVEHWAIVGTGADGTPVLDEKTSADEAARLEAKAVARDIASLRAGGVVLSGMGILMRSWSKVQVLLEALRRHGIPYAVGRDRSFFRTREVVEASALVRLVLDPHDPLALAAVLRSPMAGVPDAALAPLWRRGLPGLAGRLLGGDDDPRDELEAAVAGAKEAVEALDLDAMEGLDALSRWPEALLAFLDTLARLRRSWREDPPDRFLETLRRLTLVEPLAAARFPGAHRLANVDRFLRALEEQLLAGATAGELLRWLRRVARERPDQASGRPREDATETVQVLTIHGAKGLEFDHVWLVQTHSGRRHDQQEKNDAGRLPGEGGRWELSLAGLVTPGYHRLRERRQRVAEAERIRLLYVALTRAKDRLVTSGAWNARDAGPFLTALRQRSVPGSSGWPTLEDLWDEVRGEPDGRLERHGALWSLPTLASWTTGMEAADPVGLQERGGTGVRAADDEIRLRGLRATAAARQARPWVRGISHEAHRELAEVIHARTEGAETPEEEAAPARSGVPRDVATAVGSAVHRVLERFDHGAADPDAELRWRHDEAVRWLETAIAPDRLAAARTHLNEILNTFRNGPLWSHWLGLAGHVLARELPVLLPPSGDDPEGPVGALTGFVDLLYRDPATGELVVADYKTDTGHIEDRARAYAGQLAAYARAIQHALELPAPPRTELWFLSVGTLRGSGT